MIKPIVRRKISINYQRKNVIMVPELFHQSTEECQKLQFIHA